MRSVHVGVGHDDDAVIPQLGDVEIFRADAAAECRDHRLDFVAAEHLVEARLLDVQDLALQRQDRLEATVAALLGGATRRFALDDVEFALGGVPLLAVGELARKGTAVECSLAAHQVAGLAGRVACTGRIDGFPDDLSRDAGVLLEKLTELVVDDRLDDSLDLGVSELGLRLSFELRMRQS